METYYFHIREGARFEEDLEGADYSSPEEARQGAIEAARKIVAVAVLNGDVIDGRVFEVVTASGRLVAAIPFVSVLRL